MDISNVIKDYKELSDIAIKLAIKRYYEDYPLPDDTRIKTTPDPSRSSIIVTFYWKDGGHLPCTISLSKLEEYISTNKE